ncbi:MAG TPA: hypothetical protein VIR38_09100 [Thalassobaculum sp.]
MRPNRGRPRVHSSVSPDSGVARIDGRSAKRPSQAASRGCAARLIYFCSSQARERDVFTVPEPDSLQFMDVARRVYFDIGAGLPDHQD